MDTVNFTALNSSNKTFTFVHWYYLHIDVDPYRYFFNHYITHFQNLWLKGVFIFKKNVFTQEILPILKDKWQLYISQVHTPVYTHTHTHLHICYLFLNSTSTWARNVRFINSARSYNIWVSSQYVSPICIQKQFKLNKCIYYYMKYSILTTKSLVHLRIMYSLVIFVKVILLPATTE